jgi:hypothetical protein
MRRTTRVAFALAPAFLLAGCAGFLAGCAGDERASLPRLAPERQAELTVWIDEHALPPREYVVKKLADHDVVFLGEYHRIRRDPLFVQSLIPALQAAGVHQLGIEFACAADQPLLDSLLAAPEWDEALAREIQWRQWPWWGYREYVDIHRAAWELNRSLAPEEPPFRVLGLNARMDWSHVRKEGDLENPEIRARVFPDGDSDEVMARTALAALGSGGKLVCYMGINHAYTRFGQPIWNAEEERLVRTVTSRAGQRVREEIGDRCCTIYLHAPWPPPSGYDGRWILPAGGEIDAVLAPRPPGERRLGFDVTAGTPFGRLPLDGSFWGHVGPDATVSDWCDGWIWLGTPGEAEGVHVIEGWFTEENRADAVAQSVNPDWKRRIADASPEDLTAALAHDADIPRRFRHLP